MLINDYTPMAHVVLNAETSFCSYKFKKRRQIESNGTQLLCSFRLISDLPILWPTGVEKGFPMRNSIVSPSENIFQSFKRPLEVEANMYEAQSCGVSFCFQCEPLPQRRTGSPAPSRENTRTRARTRTQPGNTEAAACFIIFPNNTVHNLNSTQWWKLFLFF